MESGKSFIWILKVTRNVLPSYGNEEHGWDLVLVLGAILDIYFFSEYLLVLNSAQLHYLSLQRENIVLDVSSDKITPEMMKTQNTCEYKLTNQGVLMIMIPIDSPYEGI